MKQRHKNKVCEIIRYTLIAVFKTPAMVNVAYLQFIVGLLSSLAHICFLDIWLDVRFFEGRSQSESFQLIKDPVFPYT